MSRARSFARAVSGPRRAAVPVAVLVAMALTAPAPVAAQQTHLLVIGGIGGDPAYSAAFHEWATTLVDAARERYGLPAENVIYLAEDPAMDPGRIDGKSTRQAVVETVAELGGRLEPDDQVVVVLIGHGNHRDGEARFNLPGPDLTAADAAAGLALLGGRRVAVINVASASGPFLAALSGENRVVVTATKSEREQNATEFGRHFTAAFAGDEADADRDGRVSILEAFQYARLEVARAYESDDRLLTEHAMLDDDGDGQGVEEPADGGDGALAASFYLAAAPGATDDDADPALAELHRQRAALEERIAQLRSRKDRMAAADYEARLEELLVELALVSREIRERSGSGSGGAGMGMARGGAT